MPKVLESPLAPQMAQDAPAAPAPLSGDLLAEAIAAKRSLPGYALGYSVAATDCHAIAMSEFEAIRRGERDGETPLRIAFAICCAIMDRAHAEVAR